MSNLRPLPDAVPCPLTGDLGVETVVRKFMTGPRLAVRDAYAFFSEATLGRALILGTRSGSVIASLFVEDGLLTLLGTTGRCIVPPSETTPQALLALWRSFVTAQVDALRTEGSDDQSAEPGSTRNRRTSA